MHYVPLFHSDNLHVAESYPVSSARHITNCVEEKISRLTEDYSFIANFVSAP